MPCCHTRGSLKGQQLRHPTSGAILSLLLFLQQHHESVGHESHTEQAVWCDDVQPVVVGDDQGAEGTRSAR